MRCKRIDPGRGLYLQGKLGQLAYFSDGSRTLQDRSSGSVIAKFVGSVPSHIWKFRRVIIRYTTRRSLLSWEDFVNAVELHWQVSIASVVPLSSFVTLYMRKLAMLVQLTTIFNWYIYHFYVRFKWGTEQSSPTCGCASISFKSSILFLHRCFTKIMSVQVWNIATLAQVSLTRLYARNYSFA